MTSKKVWYVSKYITPRGYEKVSSRGFELLRCLSDFDCTLITSSNSHVFNYETAVYPLPNSMYGVKIKWLNSIGYSSAKSFTRILSWFYFDLKFLLYFFLNKKPDVIIVSSLPLSTAILIPIFKIFKIKVVFEVRDVWPLILKENLNLSVWHPFYIYLQFCENLGYLFSDHVVSLMPNLIEKVRVVSDVDVTCIGHGFYNEQVPTFEVNNVYNLNSEDFNIVYAGGIGYDNALDVLFRAAELLLPHKNIKIHIFGTGHLEEFYKSKYKNCTNVTFHGFINKSKVIPTLKHFDVCFLSTHDNCVLKYGQSLTKFIDYMLSSTPIICSMSGFKSMLNDAKCGSFVNSNDEYVLLNEFIRYSKMDKKSLEELGSNGYSWVLKNRNFQSLAQDYSNILKGLLKI